MHMIETRALKRRMVLYILFFTGIFLSFFILYTRIVPIVIFNMDDWSYLVPHRNAWPQWMAWNPSRVLPEILIPLTTQFGVYVIYPFLRQFRASVELGMVLVISGAVTIYAYQFFQLARKKWNAADGFAACYTILFLLLHFLVFRTAEQGNDYLLAGYYDTDVFFYYLIPSLLNGSLIMYFIREDYLRKASDQRWFRRSIVLLAVYLAIFSNLYQGVMIACYTGIECIRVWAACARAKMKPRETFKYTSRHLLILLTWLVSLVFEFFGGRSEQKQPREMAEFLKRISAAWKYLQRRLGNINGMFLAMLFIAAAVFLTITIYNRLQKRGEQTGSRSGGLQISDGYGMESLQYLLCVILMLVFLFFSCAFSISGYIQRGDVLIGAFFFIFLFVIRQIAEFNSAWKISSLLIPLMIVVCLFQTTTSARTFKTRTNEDIPVETAREITDDMIDQIISADRDGRMETVLYVPIFNTADNWPVSNSAAVKIPAVLYKYRITRNLISATMEKTEEKNIEFGIPVPDP